VLENLGCDYMARIDVCFGMNFLSASTLAPMPPIETKKSKQADRTRTKEGAIVSLYHCVAVPMLHQCAASQPIHSRTFMPSLRPPPSQLVVAAFLINLPSVHLE
jgi:hypothetical protein